VAPLQALDLETAALFAAARRLGLAAAAVLVVTGPAAGEALSDESLKRSVLELGPAALAALAAGAVQAPAPEPAGSS